MFHDEGGIPQIYNYGYEGDFTYMVMELLGPNLEDLLVYCDRSFTIGTVMKLGIQIVLE